MDMADKTNNMADKHWRSNPVATGASGDENNNKQTKARTIGASTMIKEKDIFLSLKNKNK